MFNLHQESLRLGSVSHRCYFKSMAAATESDNFSEDWRGNVFYGCLRLRRELSIQIIVPKQMNATCDIG